MKSLQELENQTLHWVQPSSWRYDYELRDEEDNVVATITRPSWWSSNAEVEAVGNRWRFERVGFWQRQIIITSIGTGTQVGEFYQSWLGGGKLVLADEREFNWQQGNFLGTKWAWISADGMPMIGFYTSGMFTTNGEMKVDPELFSTKGLSMLIFLGWYLISLHQSDSAGAAAVSVASFS